MGRAKSASDKQKVRELAEWLTALRRPSGLSYRSMALRCERVGLPVSPATLCRAEAGSSLPAWSTVKAYAKVFGVKEAEAKQKWMQAARPQSPKTTVGIPVTRLVAPAVRYITTPVELLLAMRHLWLSAGKPSLRQIESRAAVPGGGGSYLPKTNLNRILNGRRDCTKEELLHFVKACGSRTTDLDEWAAAWDRAWERQPAHLHQERALAA
jgi:transcriptional regulator with XRE-family HTH domain